MTARQTLQFDKFLGLRLANGVVDYVGGMISALKCDNVELYRYGQANNTGIRTQKGQQVIADLNDYETGYEIFGQWTSIQNGIEHWFVYAENEEKGTLFTYDNSTRTFTVRIDGLTKTGKANAITISQAGWEYFVLTNGEDLWSYSFAKTPQAKVINAVDDEGRKIKGMSLTTAHGRLWIETDDRVHWSKMYDIFTWDANDFYDDGTPLEDNSGYQLFSSPVTAVAAYIDGVVVFTERDSRIISGNPVVPTIKIQDASIGGTASYGSFVIHDQYLFFYDRLQRNIYYFLQNDVGQRRTGEPIAFEIQQYLMNIDESRLHEIKMHSIYSDGKNEIWVLVPIKGGKQNVLIYDYVIKEWTVRVQDRVININVSNNTIYSASGSCLIRENIGNLRFNSSYKLSVINMGSNTNLKIPKLIPTVTVDESYNNEFWVKINIDGKSKFKSKLIKLRFQGIFVWGDDDDENINPLNLWGDKNWSGVLEGGQRVVKLPPIPAFRWLELEFFTQNPGEEFAIKNLELKRIRIKEKTL